MVYIKDYILRDYKNINLEIITKDLANFNWNNLLLEVDVDKRFEIVGTLIYYYWVCLLKKKFVGLIIYHGLINKGIFQPSWKVAKVIPMN